MQYADRRSLFGEGVRLEVWSIAWMSVEAVAGLWAAMAAGSVDLLGFGADSLIEIASAVFLLQRLRAELAMADPRESERLERRAAAIVGGLLLLLAALVGAAALHADAAGNLVCGYMALTLLLGLALHSLWGWWWADPAAGLLVVYFIAREGLEAFGEDRATPED